MELVNDQALSVLLRRALDEDLGDTGDLTSQLAFDPDHASRGFFLAKADGLLAGGPLVERIYAILDPRLRVLRMLPDGTPLAPGRVFAAVEGPTASLLAAERTSLNFLQRLSGIATLTRAFRDKIRNFPKVRITDTRKTTPGLRALEKYAVRIGGGHNHRFGLFDAIMLKDNHLAAAGGLAAAVSRVRSRAPHTVCIEVEVETQAAALEAADAGADIVMLDNMDPDAMKRTVAALKGRVVTEASGGITLDTVGHVVKSGVDCISVGALTHSVRALDLSFEIGTPPEMP